MNEVITIGTLILRRTFSKSHGVDSGGSSYVIAPPDSEAEVLGYCPYFKTLPPCLIGIEGLCSRPITGQTALKKQGLVP